MKKYWTNWVSATDDACSSYMSAQEILNLLEDEDKGDICCVNINFSKIIE